MKRLHALFAVAALAALAATPAAARSWITLYSAPYYQGHSIDIDHPVRDLDDLGFSDRAQSARVHGSWEVCAAKNFRGDCITVNRDVPYFKQYDMNRRADSVRPAR